jgi:hypothetical protein
MKHKMTDTKFTCAKTACSNPVPFGGLFKKDREKRIKHIKEWARIFYANDKKYKTAICAEEHNMYYVVTRVNYLTSCFWMKWRNEKVNDRRKGFVELPTDKPNWLIMNRNFKRKQERMIRVMEYLIERKKRTTAVTPKGID